LPFPYGLTPDPSEDFGIHLGSIAPRGEGNVLIASLDSLLRASSNPFFPYMIERIDDGIEGRNLATKTTSIPSSTSSGDKMDSDTSGLSIHDIMTFISSLAHGQADTTVNAP
jgi:hypothetical protein